MEINISFLSLKESKTLEYKVRYSINVIKVISSLLNTEGGKIVIGVREDINNQIIGVKNPQKIIDFIKNDISGHLTSNAPFIDKVSYSTLVLNDISIVVVDVLKSSNPVFFDDVLFIREGDRSIIVKDVNELYDRLSIQSRLLRPVHEYRNNGNLTSKNAYSVFQVGNLPKGSFVYKYMDLEAALLSLCGKRSGDIKQTLRFVEPSFWQDQYEGRFYNADYRNICSDGNCFPFLYACCVSTCHEDESAWSIYSYDAKGLHSRCVQFKINRIKLIEQIANNCKEGSKIYLGGVSYKHKAIIDKLHLSEIKMYDGTTEHNDDFDLYFRNFNIDKYIQLLLLKRIAYEHEKEFRIFIVPPMAIKKIKTQDIKQKKSDPLYIKINWLDVLEGIQIDSRCSDYEKSLLQEAIDKLIESKESICKSEIDKLKEKLKVTSTNIHEDESRKGAPIVISKP